MRAVGAGNAAVGRNRPCGCMRACAGQATTELVGMLPIVVAVVIGVAQLLATGLARELADHAAEAGAVAILQGADPARAARAALPGWAHSGVAVTVHADRVRVTVDPPGPARWTATAVATPAREHALARWSGAGMTMRATVQRQPARRGSAAARSTG